MKRTIFRYQSLNDRFNKEGYITLPLLNEEQLHNLFNLLNELKAKSDNTKVNVSTSYELSFFNENKELKKDILEKIYTFFKPILDNILDDYTPIIINLFNKKPTTGEVPLHQNWTFVDESKYTSVSVWIPLCDVSKVNGTLEVSPGTHNTLTAYRSPSIPWVFKGLEKKIIDNYMVPLNLKVGQVAILDDAILHYSGVNKSPNDRGTIQLIMKPTEAKAIHYYCDKNVPNELEVFEVNEDFFTKFNMHQKPEGVPLIEKMPFTYKPIKNISEFSKKVNY